MTPTEINRRVAEACGLKVQWDRIEEEWNYSDEWLAAAEGKPVVQSACSDLLKNTFDPYRDANDALWATTRVGLLDQNKHGGLLTQNYNSQEWSVEGMEPPHSTYGPTLPAAICNAILTLDAKAVK